MKTNFYILLFSKLIVIKNLLSNKKHSQNPIIIVIASHRSGRFLGAFDGRPTIHRVGCVHPLVANTKRPIGQGQYYYVEVGICNDMIGSHDIEYGVKSK